jgi:transposase
MTDRRSRNNSSTHRTSAASKSGSGRSGTGESIGESIGESTVVRDGAGEPVGVYGGVDTHHDVHVLAAVTVHGVLVGHHTVPATPAGYRQAVSWLRAHGPVIEVGVEGTRSYGAGLTRHLQTAGMTVVEVTRPDRSDRRRRGKSDPIDAENAARAALAQHRTSTVKPGTGPVEAIRVLRLARHSAIKARTAAINQMHSLVLTAPDPLRSDLEHLPHPTLVARAARLRPSTDPTDLTDPTRATKKSLRTLARRVTALEEEITDLTHDLDTLVAAVAPRTVASFGAGTETVAQLLITISDNPHRFHSEASFAHLCGTAPVPASSGRRDRHRLNRGGDRHANSALHMIVLSRLAHHQPTKTYKQRRTSQGLTGPDIRRCLKRYVARQLYPLLQADLQTLHNHQQAA